MLDIALLVLLIIGFFTGLRRGLIMQLLHLTGDIIAYFAAYTYCNQLASKLAMWIPYPNFGGNASLKLLTGSPNLEAAFYHWLAFIIIFVIVKIILRFIARTLHTIAQLPILKQLNIWAGGILGFCEVYLILFILLYIAALIPSAAIQNTLDHSMLAGAIVNHTPVLSQQLKQLWTEYGGTALTSL